MLTIGDVEVENKNLSVRTRENKVVGQMEVEEFINAIMKEFEEKSLTSSF